MMADWLNPFIDWIQANPEWSYVLVFLTAALESLAIVGLFLPGAILMFAIGTLVAAGALPLAETLLVAVLGAVVGDGVSFYIGRHFHQQLRVIWPFKRYPRLVNHGVDFFTRHGGKSVLFARFVGPVRPILPAVAGMLDMPASRFFAVNIVSAILWSPAYILPGVVFGASLGLAAEVAGRLAVILVVLIAAVWLTGWLIHRCFNLLQPRLNLAIHRLQHWGRSHPRSQAMLGALLEPDHPEARGLAQMLVLLFIVSLLFAFLITTSMTGIDRWVYAILSDLHTPLADTLMLSITEFGSAWVIGPTLAVLLAWLAVQRNWQALWHALFAVLSTFVLVHILKNVFQTERPLSLYSGINEYGFPSSHTAGATVLYGFFAVMLARELNPARRWLPYSLAALIVTAIGLSRLYLGLHWLSEVLGGLMLGLAISALFGIAYRRHPARPLHWRRTLAIGLVVLMISANLYQPPERQLIATQEQQQQTGMTVDEWWHGGWRQLPAYRIDIANRHDHPLNIQYAGNLDELSAAMQANGWEQTPFPAWTESLRWLIDIDDPLTYPLLPQVHDGRYETIRWTQRNNDESLYVLRLWSAFGAESTLWIGNVSEVEPRESFGLLHYLVTTDNFGEAVRSLLCTSCSNLSIKAKMNKEKTQEVFLIRPYEQPDN